MTNTSFNAIIQLFRANAYLEDRMGGGLGAMHGLGIKELMFLMHVQNAEGGRLSRVNLAKRLHISASTVTRMARPLEKLGIIAREDDARDARLAYVVLTPTGEELLNNAKATFKRMSDNIFRDLWSKDDISALATLTGRITAGLPGHLT